VSSHCEDGVRNLVLDRGNIQIMAGDPRPDWVRHLEQKYGLPLRKIPGTIYGLCYDPPVVVRSVSIDYAGHPPKHDDGGYLSAGSIAHYVGWTQQRDPYRRIGDHHPPQTRVTVTVGKGTMEREDEIKRTATCPTCSVRYSDSLTR
jgi:hypothetical protein